MNILNKSLCIGALALSLIGGCTKSLESGKITEKRYESQKVYIKRELVKSPSTYELIQYMDDEDFIITFARDFKGVPHSKTVYVSKEVYDSLNEGDVFDTSKFLYEDSDQDFKNFSVK